MNLPNQDINSNRVRNKSDYRLKGILINFSWLGNISMERKQLLFGVAWRAEFSRYYRSIFIDRTL